MATDCTYCGSQDPCTCVDGVDGVDGKDGRGISKVDIAEEGGSVYLDVTYSDGAVERVLLPVTSGSVGPTGPAGADGDDGSSSLFYSSTGTPPSGFGDDGDWAVNVDGDIFTKSSSTWTATGDSLVGPQGPTGLTGAAGADGADGVDGIDGVDGNNGFGYDSTFCGDSIDVLDTAATTVTGISITTSKAYNVGSRVRFAEASNPATNYFEGVITSYDPNTGATEIGGIDVKEGSGTISNWTVSITGDTDIVNSDYTTGEITYETRWSDTATSGYYGISVKVDNDARSVNICGGADQSSTGSITSSPIKIGEISASYIPAESVFVPVTIHNTTAGDYIEAHIEISKTSGDVNLVGYDVPSGEDVTVHVSGTYRLV